jgi:hypothetical protein
MFNVVKDETLVYYPVEGSTFYVMLIFPAFASKNAFKFDLHGF